MNWICHQHPARYLRPLSSPTLSAAVALVVTARPWRFSSTLTIFPKGGDATRAHSGSAAGGACDGPHHPRSPPPLGR